MRRITLLSLLAVTLLGGVASADRGHGRGRGGGHWRQAPGGVVVRDHRAPRVRVEPRIRAPRHRVRYERRPVYVNSGRFIFNGGITRTYHRPVIKYRYYDYRYRPQLIVENYDPVPGYIWVQGQWQWNGYEWLWVSGYYAPDPSYSYNYDSYDSGYYDEPDHDHSSCAHEHHY